MKPAHSKDRIPAAPDAAVADILSDVSAASLRAFVEMLAFPRHYFAEHKANRRARNLLLKVTRSFGYRPILQGTYDNIVVTSEGAGAGPFILLGAHYDSVPGHQAPTIMPARSRCASNARGSSRGTRSARR